MMTGTISLLRVGGNWSDALARVTQLSLNSRVGWLASGILTSWFFGAHRAPHLQNQKLNTMDVDHSPEECRTQRCATRVPAVRSFTFDQCGCLKEHFRSTAGNWYHEREHEDAEGKSVSHTPMECRDLVCVSKEGQGQDRCFKKANSPCSQEHFEENGRFYHSKNHSWPVWDQPLSWKSWIISDDCLMAVFVLYFIPLLAGVWGGGRLPLSARSFGYVMAQTGAKYVDAAVVASCIIGHVDHKKYGHAKTLSPLPTLKKWKRASSPALTLGIIYFGLRITDGYWMAASAPNTLPFTSLAKQLLSLRR